MRFILRYLELILSGAGVAVTVAVPMAFTGGTAGIVFRWKIAALTAVLVGIIHGMIFYAVRSRQRRSREETVRQVRGMLQDIIRNQLTVIQTSAELAVEDGGSASRWAKMSIDAAKTIDRGLSAISVDALRGWQEKYNRVA